MKLTINEKKDNSLLGRTEVSGSLVFEASTPSNNELVLAISKELKSEPELIVMKHIHNKFGEKKAVFLVYAYNTLESKQKFEVVTKHLRKQAEEAAKKSEEEKKVAAEAKAKAEEAKSAAEEKPADLPVEEEKKEE
ncbi:MAG: hypothetical protein ABIH82_01240 [Candidatus Woesearchaeota archaeon]